MNIEKIAEIKDKMVKSISVVPGLIGLVNGQEADTKILSGANMVKGIEILETLNGYETRVFIISSANVRAKIVSSEVSSSIKALFKKEKISIKLIVIFIRGVK